MHKNQEALFPLKTKKWFIGEAIFAVASIIVILFADKHRAEAFTIFTSYMIVVGVLSIALTVYWQTSRKRVLEDARRRLSFFIDRLSMPAVLWNESLSLLVCNAPLLAILGLGENDTPTTAQFLKLLGVEKMNEDAIRRLLVNTTEETTCSAADGDCVSILWTTSGIEQSDTECWFVSVGVNITEQLAMQAEIQDYADRLAVSESRYALSMELSEIGILLTEQDSDTFYISPELQKMLGLASQSLSYTELRHKIHPSDAVIYDTYIKSIPRLTAQISDTTQNLELRIRAADGRYHWFSYCYKAAKLSDASAAIIGGSFIDITRDREKDATIERLAYVDEVTGIPNRNKLMLMGEEIYACCKELNTTYVVMVLDIDRFHLVNDTCGYENGNRILKDFAHIMYKYLSFGGFGARISGDNFALIMRDYGDDELPVKTMERIQNDLSDLARDLFPNKPLTCSAGYSRMPGDGKRFADVLEHAEFALSSCETHKGTVIGYNSSMHDEIISESELEKQLADAIEDGQLQLYYQPKISLSNGRIIGVEALIRWIRPDGTIIQPGSFVPLAETSQLISKISQYVLTEACEQNRIWQRLGLPNIVMSINLTSADFYQGNVRELVYEALARTGLEPQWLEVELTESLAIKDIDLAISQMNQLREMGVKLAMDDFGTGYSSLSYIQVLPITLLKLDRSFVINLEHDSIAQEIVAAVIRIAKSKHIETIAEGIETPEQARLLRVAGCDNAQGYLYGRPMPPKEIEEFIRRNINHRQMY